MKIAVSVNGQFGRITGVQQYVDCLMGGLCQQDTPHEIVAFASALTSREMLANACANGIFEWRMRPNTRMNTAGSDYRLVDHIRGPMAEVLDRQVVTRLKGRTAHWRAVQATRRYDVMHIPDAHIMDFVDYQPKRLVATIYDVTTLTIPQAHSAENIATWAKYFEFVKTRCARVLTISEFSKRDIMEHLHIPADRIDVTPLAARASAERIDDPAVIQSVREKFGIFDKRFVLYSGTLEPRKNLLRLVEAFTAAVSEAGLADVRLVLAGGHWADYDTEIRRHAAALGVGEHVILTGYVSNAEMNALMSSCTVFAYVSEYEGFGLPPLEAMVCGAPVVASGTTSLPEVIGEAGIAVDPMDVDAIGAALHLLLTDFHENSRRRTLARQQAELFSWKRTAELTLASYEAAAS